jgi:hypothetical protein
MLPIYLIKSGEKVDKIVTDAYHMGLWIEEDEIKFNIYISNGELKWNLYFTTD